MHTNSFDTHKLAQKLLTGGFSPKQATVAAIAVMNAISEWHPDDGPTTSEGATQGHAVRGGDAQILEAIAGVEEKLGRANAEIRRWIFVTVCVPLFLILALLVALMHSIGVTEHRACRGTLRSSRLPKSPGWRSERPRAMSTTPPAAQG